MKILEPHTKFRGSETGSEFSVSPGTAIQAEKHSLKEKLTGFPRILILQIFPRFIAITMKLIRLSRKSNVWWILYSKATVTCSILAELDWACICSIWLPHLFSHKRASVAEFLTWATSASTSCSTIFWRVVNSSLLVMYFWFTFWKTKTRKRTTA